MIETPTHGVKFIQRSQETDRRVVKWHHWGVFIANFEQILHIFPVFANANAHCNRK